MMRAVLDHWLAPVSESRRTKNKVSLKKVSIWHSTNIKLSAANASPILSYLWQSSDDRIKANDGQYVNTNMSKTSLLSFSLLSWMQGVEIDSINSFFNQHELPLLCSFINQTLQFSFWQSSFDRIKVSDGRYLHTIEKGRSPHWQMSSEKINLDLCRCLNTAALNIAHYPNTRLFSWMKSIWTPIS